MRDQFIEGVQTLAEIRAKIERIRDIGDYTRFVIDREMSEMFDTINNIHDKIYEMQVLWASLQHLPENQTKQNSKSDKRKPNIGQG